MSADLEQLLSEKGLPANPEAERSILGGIILDNPLMADCAWGLRPDYFYVDSHRRIFSRMVELFEMGYPIDIITLAEQLTKHKEISSVGGVAFLTSLTDGVPRRQVIDHFVKLVREKHTLRTVLNAVRQTSLKIVSGEFTPAECVTSLEDALVEVTTIGKQARHIGDLLLEATNQIVRLREVQDTILGFTFDFPPLDELTTGIRSDEFWVVGARPNVGKTPFGMQIAIANALRQKRVVVFTLEMADLQITNRCLIHYGAAKPWELRDPRRMTTDDLNAVLEGAASLSKYPLWIDDTGSITLRQLCNKIRYVIRRLGAELIIVDYLQLVDGGGKNPYEGVSNVAKGMRAIVRETKVPIVALSQLNRNAKDQTKEPHLGDLRESGVIEQEANGVILLHRPVVLDENDDVVELSSMGKLILAKVREGAGGFEPAQFDENTLTWQPA